MITELIEYLNTLRIKINEGMEKIKTIDIEDEKFARIMNNINTASTIISNVEERLNKVAPATVETAAPVATEGGNDNVNN